MIWRKGKDRKKKSLVHNIIHQDQKEVLNILTKIPSHTLEVFFQKAIQLEQDLKGYADSVLAFDHLFMWMREKVDTLSNSYSTESCYNVK